ncbi:MAG TPA: FUSC family protein [Candidatus Methylacidiphilales bacterium]|nr:FUSC family protein [Candidatus Methylacidiphilales bacterium]
MHDVALSRTIWTERLRGAGNDLLALLRLEFLPATVREAVPFALRTWFACMLALYLAFFLQLDQPYWAGMAVWMGTQPTPGMAISKGYYRIVGTLIGSVAGVVLIAFFAQTPELFILALALWVGACTVASNLLRNFRAYATVLAGYTAAVIALGAYNIPNQTFDIAMARGSATIIGIACSAMVTELFAPRRAREKTLERLRQVIRTSMRRAAFPLTGTMQERLALGRPAVTEMIALDAEIEFAAAESAEFRIHADLARSLLAHLFGVVSAKRSLEDPLLRRTAAPDEETVHFYEETMKLLEGAPQKIDADQWKDLEDAINALRFRIRQYQPDTGTGDIPRAVSSRIVLDRLDDLLRHEGRAVRDWQIMQGGWRYEPTMRLNFHRDQRAAWIHGARAALGVIVAGAFWIASAWSSGSLMLTQAAVVCSLFSTAPRPEQAGFAFFKGCLAAAVAGFICNFFILQKVDGFVLFALVFGLFLIPGAVLFFRPQTSATGLAYCVLFIVITRPLNPPDYDVVSFLNNATAIIFSVAFGVMTYKLFMPPNPRAARGYAVYRTRLGLQNLARLKPVPPPWAWQTRMTDRVNRLYDPTNPSGTSTDEWYEGGLAALNLGNEVLRLRMLLDDRKPAPQTKAALFPVLKSFGEIVTNPNAAQRAIEAGREALAAAGPAEPAEAGQAWLRALGILQEMEAFFLQHPGFLTPR